MTEISGEWEKINEQFCLESIEYIQHLESGSEDHTSFKDFLKQINLAQIALK